MTTRLDAAQKAALDEIESLMRMAHEEGERRATAAIVAYLKSVDGYNPVGSLIPDIERGDHLKPLDT